MTLSWRVQNIVVIGRVYFTLECFEFSSNLEFDRNMLSGTGARRVMWLIRLYHTIINNLNVCYRITRILCLIHCMVIPEANHPLLRTFYCYIITYRLITEIEKAADNIQEKLDIFRSVAYYHTPPLDRYLCVNDRKIIQNLTLKINRFTDRGLRNVHMKFEIQIPIQCKFNFCSENYVYSRTDNGKKVESIIHHQLCKMAKQSHAHILCNME